MRLIDIEDVALLKTVTDGGLSAKKLWRRINNQPTVDAVHVIRCKDCKYWGADGYRNGCKYATCIMMENDYCSMAERKEGK